MDKKIIIIGGIVLLVLIGGYFLTQEKDESDISNETPTEVLPGEEDYLLPDDMMNPDDLINNDIPPIGNLPGEEDYIPPVLPEDITGPVE